jgi:hypothetical protein
MTEEIEVIEIQMRTPEDMLQDVVYHRSEVADKVDAEKRLKAYLEETMAFQAWQEAKEDLKQAKALLETSEASARIRLEIHVEQSEESQGFGWKTRNVEDIEYGEEQALAWAMRQPIESGLVVLNKKQFEKTAKKTRGTNLENSTDEFVTFSPRVQIMLTKELNPSDEE